MFLLALTDNKGEIGKIARENGLTRKALEAAKFDSVRGAFKFNKNHFPIQDYFLRVIVKDAKGQVTNRTLSTVFKSHSDAYVGACNMPAM